MDGWSDYRFNTYQSIVVYYTDDLGIQREFLLGFRICEGPATSIALLNMVENVLREYNLTFLDFNLFVSDGESKMKKLASLMHTKNPNLSWIWCVAHRVQLALNKALKDNPSISEFMDRMFAVILKIRRTKQGRSDLLNFQVKHKTTKLTLKYKNLTRWTSRFDALERLLSLFESALHTFRGLNGAFVNDTTEYENLDSNEEGFSSNRNLIRAHLDVNDEVRLKNIVTVLEPTKAVTKELQTSVVNGAFQLSFATSALQKTTKALRSIIRRFNEGTTIDVAARQLEISFARSFEQYLSIIHSQMMNHPLVIDSFALDIRLPLISDVPACANRLASRIKMFPTPNAIQGMLPKLTFYRDYEFERESQSENLRHVNVVMPLRSNGLQIQ